MKSAFGTSHGPPLRIHHRNVVAPYRPDSACVGSDDLIVVGWKERP